MDYLVAWDPGLDVTTGSFINDWNGDDDLRALGVAGPITPASRRFEIEPAVAAVLLGVASNAIYDALKSFFDRRTITKKTSIVEHELPDGSHLLVVEIEEYR